MRYFLLLLLLTISTPGFSQCWVDMENIYKEKAYLQDKSIKILQKLLTTDKSCVFTAVFTYSGMMIYNRQDKSFWNINLIGMKQYKATPASVREIMKGYFSVDWNLINRISDKAIISTPASSNWTKNIVRREKKLSKRTSKSKKGNAAMTDRLPFGQMERNFLKANLPQRFNESFFTAYLN